MKNNSTIFWNLSNGSNLIYKECRSVGGRSVDDTPSAELTSTLLSLLSLLHSKDENVGFTFNRFVGMLLLVLRKLGIEANGHHPQRCCFSSYTRWLMSSSLSPGSMSMTGISIIV